MGEEGGRGGTVSGYRVLDLTDEKGMFCSRLLADMGAEVIRVEEPGGNSARSHFFWATNLGKRSITLNLEVEEGQELFRRVAGTADVVVESYQPGYLAALGLNYAELGRINPRLIMASITNFGQSGPYWDYSSCDIVAGVRKPDRVGKIVVLEVEHRLESYLTAETRGRVHGTVRLAGYDVVHTLEECRHLSELGARYEIQTRLWGMIL